MVTEALIYVCFAVLMGHSILGLVPADRRPAFRVPNGLLLASALGIGILSFGPVLRILLFFSQNGNFPFANVVLDSRPGMVWLITFVASVLYVVFLAMSEGDSSKRTSILSLAGVVILIVMTSFSGHVASTAPVIGVIAQSMHITSMAAWAGILLIMAWFARNKANWSAFLSWYTPFSIGSMILLTAAGLILMQYTVPEYWNSWLLPYGEALLLKHLLYAGVLTIAAVNAFLLKKGMFPSWLRAESIVIGLIFLVTGFMGQSSPPLDVSETVQSQGVSPLFSALYQGIWQPAMSVQVELTTSSLFWLGITAVLAICQYLVLRERKSAFLYALLVCGIVLSLFMTIMLAIVPS
ncbi:hypothetical protein LCM20_16630 [Halobacillus litoralis]|uniref:copper resistance D family protein n=1 Tax=Halobacillus litoralis TaxID=45668 RepID=UPI001CD2D074|nr:hypothetical protein [Halobacillus litoralis]MCA0972236.1 hypothetical protein [Halobacillus litoralis]